MGLVPGSAVVTGGSGSIGAAVGRHLARAGADIGIVDLSVPEISITGAIQSSGREHRFVAADVREFDAADRAIREIESALGPPGILVCCAGISRDHACWNMDENGWREVLDVNLTGAFAFVRAVAPGMRRRESGRIVLISSINGMRGKFGLANYSASKAGIIGMTRTLARELGPKGITVNAVAPGFIRTPLTAHLEGRFEDDARRESALGRIGEPDDVAALVSFLCSEEGRHITGQAIAVDGGQIA